MPFKLFANEKSKITETKEAKYSLKLRILRLCLAGSINVFYNLRIKILEVILSFFYFLIYL